MYASYFGLREEPFGLTPDPAFLYLSPCHRAALAAIGDGLLNRRGLLLLMGEVGTGKTTLVYSLLGQIDPQIDVAFVTHSTQTFEELLAAALEDLGVEASSDSKAELVSALNVHVEHRAGEGRTVALVVDEAQNLMDEAFEEFRLLSTCGTSQDSLQIVLVGQPEFEHRLRQPPLRRLRDQASVCAFITPLSAREMERYIAHRLELVGGSMAELIAPSALRQIVRRTEGIPRRANILCHNALLFAYGRALPRVTPQIAREVIAEMDGRRPGVVRWHALQRVATRSRAMRAVAANAVGALRAIVRRTERTPRRATALSFRYGRGLPRRTSQTMREQIAATSYPRRQTLQRVSAGWEVMRAVAAGVTGVLREMVRRTERIPRRAHALLFGYGRELSRVVSHISRNVIAEMGFLHQQMLRRTGTRSESMRAAAAGVAALALVAVSHAALVGLRGEANGPRGSPTIGAPLRFDGGPVGPPPTLPAPFVDDPKPLVWQTRVATTSGEMAVPEAPATAGFCLTTLRSRHGVTPDAFAVSAVSVRNSTGVAPVVLHETRPSGDRKRASAGPKLPSWQPRGGSQTAGGTHPPRTERLASAGGRSSPRLRSPRQASKQRADRGGIFQPVVRFLNRVFTGAR